MNKINIEEVKNILKIGGIDLEKNKFKINNKNYNRKQLLIDACDFKVLSEERIELKNKDLNLRNDEIYHLFLANVFKTTKFGYILPSLVFFLISLISLTPAVLKQTGANFGFINITSFQIAVLYLFALIFMFFSIFCFVNYFCLKNKIILVKIGRQNRYKHISKKEYEKTCEILKKNCDIYYINFKPVETERLIIREYTINDVFDVYDMFKKDSFTKYMRLKKMECSDEAMEFILDCRKKYAFGMHRRLAIVEKTSNKAIGMIGLSLSDLSKTTCQVIYGLNEDYWHKGYMQEALKGYLNTLYEQGFNYIIAGHVEENIDSGKVMLKCGFKRCESRDNKMEIKGKIVNIFEYIIDKRDDNNEGVK